MEKGPRGTRARWGEVEAPERAMSERASRTAAAGVAAIGAGGENGEDNILLALGCGLSFASALPARLLGALKLHAISAVRSAS
jgi:hypothetical protein